MEAIYFGNGAWFKNRGGPGGPDKKGGPWAGADLEAGMYYGGGAQTVVNNQSEPLTSDFVSLHLKGRTGAAPKPSRSVPLRCRLTFWICDTDGFAIKGGDATKGPLKTMYDGARPDPKLACCDKPPWSYQPMQKQGAIILGTVCQMSAGSRPPLCHLACSDRTPR